MLSIRPAVIFNVILVMVASHADRTFIRYSLLILLTDALALLLKQDI